MIFLLSFSSAFSFFVGWLWWRWRRELTVAQRVDQIIGKSDHDTRQIVHDLGTAIVKRLVGWIERVTPADYFRRVEAEVRRAGIRGPKAVRYWLLIRAGALLCGFVIGVLVWGLSGSTGGFLVAMTLLIAGVLGPRLYLTRTVKKQQSLARRALPNLLDMLTISVEAGLGFDQALARTVKNMNGLLGLELRQALAEMSLGKTRREALRDAAVRMNLDEFGSFVGAIVQADRLGMGVATVLRVQSGEVRGKLRQRAEEQAMKAPIKILFPLVLFIFPGLFMIILGPAVLHIMHVLG
ncbi:MAG: type II secretion system F family protein [Bacilli bacterium]